MAALPLEKSTRDRLVAELGEMLASNSTAIELGHPIGLIDAFFMYRLLLGRTPSQEEINYLSWKVETCTRRELLRELLASREYGRGVPLLPAGQFWMADLEKFRLWFDTTDVEMGAKMAMGTYEPEVARTISEHVKEGMTAVDVGAQCGYYSLLLASKVGSRGQVLAIEARPTSVGLIKKNVEENQLGTTVQVLHMAASDRPGVLDMFETSGMFVAGHEEGKPSCRVNCAPLDEILDGKRVDFLKIDVEGHEPKVLVGLNKTIARCKPKLLIELNEYWLQRNSSVSSADVLRSLEASGFGLWLVDTGARVTARSYSVTNVLENAEILAIPDGVR